MEKMTVAEVQNLTAPELVERIPSMPAADLVELRKLENESSRPRTTVIAAIDAAEAKLAENQAAAGTGDNPAGTVEDPTPGGDPTTRPSTTEQTPPPPLAKVKADTKADETPEWQKPDYAGPLDIQQAEWRRRNIKPVTQVRTK